MIVLLWRGSEILVLCFFVIIIIILLFFMGLVRISGYFTRGFGDEVAVQCWPRRLT